MTFTKVLSGAKNFEIRPKSSANLSSVFVIFFKKSECSLESIEMSGESESEEYESLEFCILTSKKIVSGIKMYWHLPQNLILTLCEIPNLFQNDNWKKWPLSQEKNTMILTLVEQWFDAKHKYLLKGKGTYSRTSLVILCGTAFTFNPNLHRRAKQCLDMLYKMDLKLDNEYDVMAIHFLNECFGSILESFDVTFEYKMAVLDKVIAANEVPTSYTNFVCHDYKAIMYSKLEKYEEVVKVYQNLLNSPCYDENMALFNLATAYKNWEKFELAMEVYKRIYDSVYNNSKVIETSKETLHTKDRCILNMIGCYISLLPTLAPLQYNLAFPLLAMKLMEAMEKYFSEDHKDLVGVKKFQETLILKTKETLVLGASNAEENCMCKQTYEWMAQSFCFLQENKFGDALALIDQVHQMTNEDTLKEHLQFIYGVKAICYDHIDSVDAALCYEKMVDLIDDRSKSFVHFLAGQAFFEGGLQSEAESHLKKAIVLHDRTAVDFPDWFIPNECFRMLGRIFYATMRPKRAIECLESIRGTRKEHARSIAISFALSSLSLKDPDEAIGLIRQYFGGSEVQMISGEDIPFVCIYAKAFQQLVLTAPQKQKKIEDVYKRCKKGMHFEFKDNPVEIPIFDILLCTYYYEIGDFSRSKRVAKKIYKKYEVEYLSMFLDMLSKTDLRILLEQLKKICSEKKSHDHLLYVNSGFLIDVFRSQRYTDGLNPEIID